MKDFKKRKRLWLLAFIPMGGALWAASLLFPSFAEWYATSFYPLFSGFFAWATSFATFSLAEVALWILLAALIIYPLWVLFMLIRVKTNRKKRAVLYVTNPIIFAGILFFLFVSNCGVNYQRLPFASVAGLDVKESSTQELSTLCKSLAAEVNSLRAEVTQDANGVATLTGDFIKTADEAKLAFDKISDDYSFLKSGYNQPKPVILSTVMSYMNITGIFSPFTFEANINIEAPRFHQPSTMAHELAHLRGFVREDEANFIAVLVCEQSQSPAFKYSGAVLSYLHSINALYAAAPESATEISATLNDDVKRDFAFNNEYWQKFNTKIGEISTAVNDSYLKINGQTDGVKSYGRMVDLLLARQRSNTLNVKGGL